jgi:single-stranded DNA-binding protein
MLGRLTAPPDFRMTPNNEAVCRFRIAVPRTKEKSDFFNIVA